jgi:hypothetical protein
MMFSMVAIASHSLGSWRHVVGVVVVVVVEEIQGRVVVVASSCPIFPLD